MLQPARPVSCDRLCAAFAPTFVARGREELLMSDDEASALDCLASR
jgi:hypothetical protein